MIRNFKIFHGDEVVDEGEHDVTWTQVRNERNIELRNTDWRATFGLSFETFPRTSILQMMPPMRGRLTTSLSDADAEAKTRPDDSP